LLYKGQVANRFSWKSGVLIRYAFNKI